MSGFEPTKIDYQGIKLISEDETQTITFNMSNASKGIILDYDLTTTPKQFSISSAGVNWNDGVSNNTTGLQRLALVQQAFQAVELPPNATTLQINDTILLTDGITSNSINNTQWTGNIQTVNTNANTTHYLNFSDSSSTGYSKPQKTAGISCNPSLNSITATTFNGALQGNADTATNVNIADDNTSATYYPVFTAGTGNQPLKIDSSTTPFSINPNTNALSFGSTIKLDGVGGSGRVALGSNAGITTQGTNSVAIGINAGLDKQGADSVAVGENAGGSNQGGSAVAVGNSAGSVSQSTGAVAVGQNAGATTQGIYSVAVGQNAGQITQGISAVAVGINAGQITQGAGCIALGDTAGNDNQGNNAVAIGNSAGRNTQGQFAVALGYQAGNSNQHSNSIVLNATGDIVNSDGTNRLFVAPIRGVAWGIGVGVLKYNPNTYEITYSTT